MSEPEHISKAVSELIAQRGLARSRGNQQLQATWRAVAGESIAAQTKVLGLRREVLEIGVAHAALLNELASFHKSSLLNALKQHPANLKIRDLKFRLKSELAGHE